MSREIKFRAWHKNANYMCKNVRTNLLYKGYLEFMQYTGLKDKNDKEIYEGDILAITFEYDNTYLGKGEEINKGVVEWKGYSDGEYVDNVECWMADNEPISNCKTEHLEVIGNIYANPNLLKED